jgi:hypothetical protein
MIEYEIREGVRMNCSTIALPVISLAKELSSESWTIKSP